MSGTSKMNARDKEPNHLIQELQKCKTKLVTQKELLIGSVNRSKANLRDFKFLEENGLSTRKLGFSIEENCTRCGKKGHLEDNCWGNCPVCGELGHKPGSCQLSPEKIKTIARKRQKSKKWEKVRKRKTQLPVPESSGQYWAESLSDNDTVIEKQEEYGSGETSEEEDMPEGIKRVKEVIGDATLEDISAAIKKH